MNILELNGEWLKDWLKSNEMSEQQLADELGTIVEAVIYWTHAGEEGHKLEYLPWYLGKMLRVMELDRAADKMLSEMEEQRNKTLH